MAGAAGSSGGPRPRPRPRTQRPQCDHHGSHQWRIRGHVLPHRDRRQRTIKAAAIQAEAGSAGAAITSDVKLDGTSITGDVDVANQAADLSFTVPPMAMLGNAPLTGDLILKDSVLYYKVSLLGAKYTKMDLGFSGQQPWGPEQQSARRGPDRGRLNGRPGPGMSMRWRD